MSHQIDVLVDETGRARIKDFGLAVINTVPTVYAVNHRYDRIQWIAPELVVEGGPFSKESNIFSFAMLMVEVRYHA